MNWSVRCRHVPLLQIKYGTKSHALGMFVNRLLVIVPQLLHVGNKSLLMLLQPSEFLAGTTPTEHGHGHIFSDKGASHSLTVLPVTSHGFSLQNQPSVMPSACAKTGRQTIFPLTALADRQVCEAKESGDR